MTLVSWYLPIKIYNESNCFSHWSVKHKRHKIQKQRIRLQFLIEKPSIKQPCKCILTRIAPRKLNDHDNLPMSFKWVVDAIAEELTGNYVPGRADDCTEIKWIYKQERGKVREYALKIEFTQENHGQN